MFLEMVLHVLVCFHYMFLPLTVELYDIQLIIVLFSFYVSKYVMFPIVPLKCKITRKSALKMIDRAQKCPFPKSAPCPLQS